MACWHPCSPSTHTQTHTHTTHTTHNTHNNVCNYSGSTVRGCLISCLSSSSFSFFSSGPCQPSSLYPSSVYPLCIHLSVYSLLSTPVCLQLLSTTLLYTPLCLHVPVWIPLHDYMCAFMITCVVGCILLPRWGLSGVLTPMACLPLMIIHACLSDYIRGRTPPIPPIGVFLVV